MDITYLLDRLPKDGALGTTITMGGIIVMLVSAILSDYTQTKAQRAGKFYEWITRRRMTALERVQMEKEEAVADLQHMLDAEKEKSFLQWSYIIYITENLRRYTLWGAKEGITFPPPPILTYDEWVEKAQ